MKLSISSISCLKRFFSSFCRISSSSNFIISQSTVFSLFSRSFSFISIDFFIASHRSSRSDCFMRRTFWCSRRALVRMAIDLKSWPFDWRFLFIFFILIFLIHSASAEWVSAFVELVETQTFSLRLFDATILNIFFWPRSTSFSTFFVDILIKLQNTPAQDIAWSLNFQLFITSLWRSGKFQRIFTFSLWLSRRPRLNESWSSNVESVEKVSLFILAGKIVTHRWNHFTLFFDQFKTKTNFFGRHQNGFLEIAKIYQKKYKKNTWATGNCLATTT